MRACLQGPALHEAVREVLSRHLDAAVYKAWIVGSEASGAACPGSDIDVAIEGLGPIALEKLASLRAELEKLPTLRSFDIVDLARTNERFRSEALAAAIPLLLEAERDHAQVR